VQRSRPAGLGWRRDQQIQQDETAWCLGSPDIMVWHNVGDYDSKQTAKVGRKTMACGQAAVRGKRWASFDSAQPTVLRETGHTA